MNNKLTYIIGGGILLVLIGLLISSSQNNKQPPSPTNVQNVTPSSSSTTQTTSQDSQDVVPGLYKNLIQNTTTLEGFIIQAATAENNVDLSGNTIGDHLELKLKNTSGKDLADFEVYYTINDPTTNKKEGYYKKLTGFVLKSGQTSSIHFDNKQGDGHFSSNKNSIYFTSSNKLFFDVSVSSPSYKVQTVKVEKAAGGAETKD